MKLSWRDTVNTLLALAGGAIVYAKFYDYSWAMIGSWRTATAILAVIGLLMVAFSAFDTRNYSILNIGEMLVGALAVGLAVVGMIVTSSPVFYSLAIALGTLWLVDTARHVRHSWMSGGSTHHPAPVH